MADTATLGRNAQIEELEIDLLHIDPSYQRDVSMDLVQKIAAEMETQAYEPILVSRRRNGDLFIVNGQHRTAAAKLAGWTTIQAKVVEGLDQKREAALRLKGNVRLTDRGLERFRAQLAAQIPESLEIRDLLERFGTKINGSPVMHEGINSAAAIESVYRRDKGVLLTRTLEVLADAWGTPEGSKATSSVLKGVSWFLEQHGGETDRNRLVERMTKLGPSALDRMARSHRAAMGGSMWVNTYRALVEMYNERLPEGQMLHWRTRGYSTNRRGGRWE